MTPGARAGLQALLKRLAGGDREAIEPAFDVVWPILRRFSARALLNEADAEDAAQQALAKVYEQACDFDPSRDGLAWVLTIVSFECRTLRRKHERRREQPLLEHADGMAEERTPEALLIERDLEADLREVLETLSAEDLQTVLAAMTDNRPSADARFRKRLQRALCRLRLAWRTKHETE